MAVSLGRWHLVRGGGVQGEANFGKTILFFQKNLQKMRKKLFNYSLYFFILYLCRGGCQCCKEVTSWSIMLRVINAFTKIKKKEKKIMIGKALY